MIYEHSVFNPTDLDLSRSTFEQHPTVSGTCNAGRLLPIKTWFVQPGDSMKVDVQSLIKMSTPVYPTMDALFADVYFFYVPHKLVLGRRYGSPSVNDASESWAAIVGAQDNLLNMPTPAAGVTIPALASNASGYDESCLMDYFPVYYGSSQSLELNALPLLSYFAIWNENFRDPNLMNPVTWSFSTGSNGRKYISPSGYVPLYATRYEVKNRTGYSAELNDYVLTNALGANATYTPGVNDTSYFCNLWLPFPVCRFHGYFGSCLPWPQRNTEGVTLPLGTSAPVLVGGTSHSGAADAVLKWGTPGGNGSALDDFLLGVNGSGNTVGVTEDVDSTAKVVPLNLYTDLSVATAANVNALRMAIQKQRWYEKLARSGNRYDELEYGLFGVRPHDSGDDRPLLLGGKRINLAIEMVASTNGGESASSGEGAGSLGSLGAFSHTNDKDNYFYHSFDDWGIVMCVVCIRHHDTFGSGTNRFWLKKTREDLYFPTFAHLGEQVIGDEELIDKSSNGTVFGYQPAWQEYRDDVDRVHGLLRPGKNLDFMTYARKFESGTNLLQFLNASSQVATVDQTLAVGSNGSGFQFVYQFTFDVSIRRAMPTDSIPGLMDHF